MGDFFWVGNTGASINSSQTEKTVEWRYKINAIAKKLIFPQKKSSKWKYYYIFDCSLCPNIQFEPGLTRMAA